MTKSIALAALALAVIPFTAMPSSAKTKMAAPTKKTASSPTMYECSKCHMKVTAAVAKKDHYKDAMDGGTLVPVKK